jgi:hypothetical protein
MDPIKRVAVIDILQEQTHILDNFPHRYSEIPQKFKEAIYLLRELHLEASENGHTRSQIVCHWSRFWLRGHIRTLEMGCDREKGEEIARNIELTIVFELLEPDECF